MRKRVRKAIFPVAGLGTRFLPVTKAIPKELLPLVDRPLIHYAIEEARASGIEDFIFVTARGKTALEDYFDTAPRLEEELLHRGKHALLDDLQRAQLPSGAVAYVRQQRAMGLGHAVWCARRLIGDEPFAVILPDDVITGQPPCLAQLIDVHARTGGNVLAVMQVPRASVSAYGVLSVREECGGIVQASGMVEKPHPDAAPSTLAAVGRYVLTPSVLDRLGSQTTGAGGEIQLTDAIAAEADRAGLFGCRIAGQRYDCGSKAGYLQATVAFALEREDLGQEFRRFLLDRLAMTMAAE